MYVSGGGRAGEKGLIILNVIIIEKNTSGNACISCHIISQNKTCNIWSFLLWMPKRSESLLGGVKLIPLL